MSLSLLLPTRSLLLFIQQLLFYVTLRVFGLVEIHFVSGSSRRHHKTKQKENKSKSNILKKTGRKLTKKKLYCGLKFFLIKTKRKKLENISHQLQKKWWKYMNGTKSQNARQSGGKEIELC